MKSFYGGMGTIESPEVHDRRTATGLPIDTHARVAVYDTVAVAPYVEDVGPTDVDQFIENLTVRVYELAQQRGGSIPYTVVREIAENLIHAGFADPVVSILDSGNTIRFADQGPGIPDKQRAVQPGYTTARSYMKSVIRGVGSGLPLVKEFLAVTGGSLTIEDNLSGGAVVTVTLTSRQVSEPAAPATSMVGYDSSLLRASEPAAGSRPLEVVGDSPSLFGGTEGPLPSAPPLTNRQKQVLALVLESGSAGPSVVSKELGVGLSTAYRDLAALEDMELIVSDSGKRTLTERGLSLLGGLSSNNDLPSF